MRTVETTSEHIWALLDLTPGDCALGLCPQQRLELGECVFDGIEVGTVGRQVEQSGARCLDRVAHAGGLVSREVVHDDDIARCERRHQHLADIGEEHGAVHRTVVDEGGSHAGQPQRAGEGGGLPMAVRHAGPAALAKRRTTAQPSHLGRQAGLVDEHQFCRIEIELAVEPGAAAAQDVGAVLLQCMCGLFLNVQPCPRSQSLKVLRPMRIERSASRRSTISFSGSRSIRRRQTEPQIAAPTPRRSSPSKHATANPHRALSPSSTSIQMNLESASQHTVTSQSIHRYPDAL